MPSSYGVANPNPPWQWAQIIGGVDVACPAGTETNVVAVVLNPVPISGAYYPVVFATITIQVGGTPITNCVVATRIGNGADIVQLPWPAWAWPANTFSTMQYYLPGTGGVLQNPTTPLTVNVSLTPQGGSVTAKQNTCNAFVRWERAFD